MKNARSADSAIWRHIRPRLKELGYEKATPTTMRRIRHDAFEDKIGAHVIWRWKAGQFQGRAGVSSKEIGAVLAAHAGQTVEGPPDWWGLLQDFWQWGILEPKRFYHGRGEFAFRAGADAELVADSFWAFYMRVIEPRLQAVRTPGDILRLDVEEIGPHTMYAPACAAAAHLSGEDERARGFLEMCMSGHAVAKEHGYAGMDPESQGWPMACSFLRALGGDPEALPPSSQPYWPTKDPRFIAKVREGSQPPNWLSYE